MSLIIMGLLLAVIPHYIFHVCEVAVNPATGKAAPMACYWTARVETGLGLVVACGCLLRLFATAAAFRVGVSAVVLLAAVLAALVPVWVVGVCAMPTMPCRAGTLPALVIVSLAIALFTLIDLVRGRRHWGGLCETAS